MKKSMIASALALSVIVFTDVSAAISVTSIDFGDSIGAAVGTIGDFDTLGSFNSIDDLLGFPWTATQETTVITNSNGVTWAGSSAIGTWDHAADIALMRDDQVAVGIFFNWNNTNGMPVLAVFDCVSTPGTCIGQKTGAGGVTFGGIQAGAIVGPFPVFSGTGSLSAVPVPAAIWLMGSGFIGLIGLARRRKVI